MDFFFKILSPPLMQKGEADPALWVVTQSFCEVKWQCRSEEAAFVEGLIIACASETV